MFIRPIKYNAMKKMFAYVRVSTARQGLGASLEAQQESIRRFAATKDMDIVRWFEEKETAAKQGRPVFAQMIKLLKSKKADGVVIHKIDRSTRNLKDWVDITNLLDSGCEVHFAHENFDLNTRSGRLMADILVTVAVDMIRNQKQETIKGQQGRLMQGLYPWRAPLGYMDQGKGKAKTVDPVAGPLVAKAFKLYATRQHTLKSLLLELTGLGLKSIVGKPLSINGISTVLNNSFYMGILQVKGASYEGAHEALVSPSLFAAVQSILKGKTNQRALRHDFTFRKMVRCELCGYSLIAEVQKGTVYYRCHTKNCATKGLKESEIERKLLAHLREAELSESEYSELESLLAGTQQGWAATRTNLLSGIRMKRAKAEEKLERLTDFYVDGGIDKVSYEKRKSSLLVELKQCDESEKSINGGKEAILNKVKKFLELAKNLVAAYEIAITQEKRDLVESITSNLSVSGKNLRIAMKSPFEGLANRNKIEECDLTHDTPRNMRRAFSAGGNFRPLGRRASSRDVFQALLSVAEREAERNGPEYEDDS